MKKLLLIDDDPLFRALLTQSLTSAGWEVVSAVDGEAGMELALLHRPQVILCDLLMPRCNGFQFCRNVRNQRARLGRPYLAIATGSSYAADRQSALDAGADEYLVKPIRVRELLALLERAMALQAPPPPDPPSGGGPGDPSVVRFWGVRGSIATPGPSTLHYGGNTPCIEVRSHGQIIILDAGTGVRPLGLALVEEFKDRPLDVTLLISHTHWDHIQGFPFFVPAYNPKNRVRLLGYEGARRGLEITLAAQMESPYFPVSLQQMPGHIIIQELRDLQFSVGSVPIEATFLNHPGICTGFRLQTTGGPVVYLPDMEPHQRFDAQGRRQTEDHETRAYVESMEQRLVDFARDAEVLIIDAQYDPVEYAGHLGWGHSSLEESVRLGLRAAVKRLFLFHHDPTHDDAKISHMVEAARQLAAAEGSPMIVEGAREGLEVVLHPQAAQGVPLVKAG